MAACPRRRGQAFFGGANPVYFVETLPASWRLPPKAADLASVRASSFCVEDKRTAALILSKPPLGDDVKLTHESNLPGNGFFSFPVGRGRLLSCMEIKEADNHKKNNLVGYRLCVCASGSLITVIFS